MRKSSELLRSEHDFCILLAGGSGTRFWPQSRILEPKQFLLLNKEKSLFEQTIDRVLPLFSPQRIVIVTSELYRHQISEMADSYGMLPDNIIYEPSAKNTAASVGAGVRLIALKDPLSRVCVLPCDHHIKNEKRFHEIMKKALASCDDSLIICGIPPHRPATGYGYIKTRKKRCAKGVEVLKVEKYCEKPDLKKAQKFLKETNYFWNSGIFIGSSEVFMREIEKNLPELHAYLQKMEKAGDVEAFWEKLDPISFDYAVLEKTTFLGMIEASGLGWSDLGSWQAWDELLHRDEDDNVFIGDVVNIGSRHSTVLGKDRLMAVLGIENLIVVDTPDALLVAKKERSEEVKKVVDILKQNKRYEHYLHKTVKRPWGSYTVLGEGMGFKIKLIEVLPGRSLSLQLHKKRSEHWVVVEGRAKVVQDGKISYIAPNESTFIPVLCPHQLMNPEDAILKIVEVQAGIYCGEDDIVRLADNYKRP